MMAVDVDVTVRGIAIVLGGQEFHRFSFFLKFPTFFLLKHSSFMSSFSPGKALTAPPVTVMLQINHGA